MKNIEYQISSKTNKTIRIIIMAFLYNMFYGGRKPIIYKNMHWCT